MDVTACGRGDAREDGMLMIYIVIYEVIFGVHIYIHSNKLYTLTHRYRCVFC